MKHDYKVQTVLERGGVYVRLERGGGELGRGFEPGSKFFFFFFFFTDAKCRDCTFGYV